MQLWPAALLCLASSVFACGDEASSGVEDADTSNDADQPMVGQPDIGWLAAGAPDVAAAALPDIACADGWHTLVDGELAFCDPYPGGGARRDCPEGQAHFVGTSECALVGSACPEGKWPADLVDEHTVFIDAEAPALGGHGTRAKPFKTLPDGVYVATGGQTIALAPGVYDGAVPVVRDVIIRGACAEKTILTATAANSAPVVDVSATHAVLRDVRIVTPVSLGALVRGGAHELEVHGVIVDGANRAGVGVGPGAKLTGDRLVVRGSKAVGALYGAGITVEAAGAVEVTQAVLEANQDGVVADGDGARVALGETLVRDSANRGVTAQSGATVTLEGSTIVDSGKAAAVANLAESNVALVDVLVRVAAPAPERRGMLIEGGATGSATRSAFLGCSEAGLMANLGATLTLVDVVVADSVKAPDGQFGMGVEAFEAAVDMTRVAITRSESHGVVISGAAAELTAVDLTVSDTRADPDVQLEGSGLIVQLGAAATVTQARLVNNTVGIGAAGVGTYVKLNDIAIADTRVNGAHAGIGLANEDATLEAHRVVIDRTIGAGMLIAGAGLATLEDIAVRDTALSPGVQSDSDVQIGRDVTATFTRLRVAGAASGGVFVDGEDSDVTLQDVLIEETQGPGLHVQGGSTCRARDMTVRAARQVGAFASGQRSVLDLQRVALLDTRELDCPEACDAPGGMAVGAYFGGDVEVDTFVIDGAALCGFHVAESGELDASHGAVAHAEAGACIEVADYLVDRLTDDVRYRDNVTLFQTDRTFPTPADASLYERDPSIE